MKERKRDRQRQTKKENCIPVSFMNTDKRIANLILANPIQHCVK
jgi:hypothetical protein